MSLSSLLDLIQSALSVTLPTFGWVILGALLARLGWLSPALIDGFSRLAFRTALPLLLALGAAGVNLAALGGATYLLAGVLATLTTLAGAWCWGRWRRMPLPELGVFAQAAFRSNLAIVGIALCHAAFGEEGLRLAALPVAILTALYNVLAVWLLQHTLGGDPSLRGVLRGLLRNPLLLGIAAGLAISVSGVSLPAAAGTLESWLSRGFLPLMLVAIGGSLRLSALRDAGRLTWEATLWRLLVGPALGVTIALLLGVRGEALGVLFLLLASPVAAASFVMVVALRGNGTLAANIIVLTTLLSALTVTAGFAFLALLGLVPA